MKRKISLALVVLLMALNGYTQNGEQTVRGQVVNAFTGRPLVGQP